MPDLDIAAMVRYWVRLADYDLKTAGAILKTSRHLYIAFMCHQVVEKLLKALYVLRRRELPPQSHNLIRLAQLVDLEMTETQKAFLTDLNPLNIETRYPDYRADLARIITRRRAQTLLAQTKETARWLRSLIPSSETSPAT